MAQFTAVKKNMDSAVSAESGMADRLESLRGEVQSVSALTGFRVTAQANIRSRLSGLTEQIAAHRSAMSGMCSALQDAVDVYARTENLILGNMSADGGGSGAVGDSLAENGASDGDGPGGGFDDFRDWTLGDLLFGLPSMVRDAQEKLEDFRKRVQDAIMERTGFQVEARTEGSLFDYQLECENGSLGVTMGAYEAYASAEGGLFSEGEDGSLVFNPHVDAKMGASVTALELAGHYGVGDEMLGAEVSGNVTVGKVSGEASVSAGLMNEDGSFDPHLKADASAEAILVDANAKGDVSLLGTEVEAEAGVNIGVGAHANVEIGDGKISCDIGASLGIGVSLSLSIDYGGTVDAVKKAAKGMAENVLNKLKWW